MKNKEVVCPICDGTGKMYNGLTNNDCVLCLGTGKTFMEPDLYKKLQMVGIVRDKIKKRS